MIALYIDNVACPLIEKPQLPTYNSSRLRSVEAWREGDQMLFAVASTPETDTLLAMPRDLYHATRFNDTYHHARFEVDGITLFEGVATLLATEQTSEGCIYRVKVRNGGAEWAKKAATTRVAQCGIEYDSLMALNEIERSWEENKEVCFLPLLRDSYKDMEDGLLPYRRQWMMMAHDYYPFISVHAIIDAILRKSGYTLQSTFLDSDLFRKLYVSGGYRTVESEEAYASMGFKAYRTRETSGRADSLGRINIWAPEGTINIGCIIDTVSPGAVNSDGTTLIDAHNNGKCLTFDGVFPVWRPKREITAAFDYHISYTTEYRIVSRHHLRGFDRLRLGNNTYVKLTLLNPYPDCRNNVLPNMGYKLMIFDGYNAEHTYHLPGLGETRSRITKMVSAANCDKCVQLYYTEPGGVEHIPFEGEWALFEGYVEECGTQRVDIDVRSAYNHYTPTSPERFHHIYFEGAEQGQQITLHSGCHVSPVFGGRVGTGEAFTFEDIAHIDYTAGSLMEAVAQMFNLRFYTDKATKRLYVEPHDDFFTDEIVDWRGRQVEITNLGQSITECFENTKYGYQPGDGIVSRMADKSGEVPGEWTFHIDGYAVKEGTKSRLNPLFAPSADITGICETAPSASVLVAGNRDVLAIEENISPRIVLYEGLATLPDDETWPSLYDPKHYPLAYFHGPSVGQTLCFEDRDNCTGLHKYHERELREIAERENMLVAIHLPPVEYASLFDPQHRGATIRSTFRLAHDAQTSLFRLLSIEHYDLDSHTAMCRFQRTLTD